MFPNTYEYIYYVHYENQTTHTRIKNIIEKKRQNELTFVELRYILKYNVGRWMEHRLIVKHSTK